MIFGNENSKILIAGQAPSRNVYKTYQSFNDISGDRLRAWLGVTRDEFYNQDIFALIPMGLCYPGYSGKGDYPPKKECKEIWHDRIFESLPNLKLKIIIGQYSIAYHLPEEKGKSLTEIVQGFEKYYPDIIPIVHPSPRNFNWLRQNPWFEEKLLPKLKQRVQEIMRDNKE